MVNNIVVPEFGMFTEKGDYEVYRIVDLAKRANLTWSQVKGLLEQLANDLGFEEATDTVVRERVWECLFYESRP
jgi:hypothetical protein